MKPPRKQLAEALELGLGHTQTVLSLYQTCHGRAIYCDKRDTVLLNNEVKQIQDALKLLQSIAIGRWVNLEWFLEEVEKRAAIESIKGTGDRHNTSMLKGWAMQELAKEIKESK